MSGGDALRILSEIATADSLSHGIVGALTVFVFVIMRTMLPMKTMALFFAPGIYWGGLTGIFLCQHWNLGVTNDKAANVAASAAVGMIAALILLVLLARCFDALTRIRNPVGGKPA